jgi:FtsP/CotA-like multicopper oxidase with cupredoxin domain
MYTNLRNKLRMGVLLLVVAALLGGGVLHGDALAGTTLAPVAAPRAAILPATPCTGTGIVTCNLWAMAGGTTLPDGASVTVWGYTEMAGGAITQPGGPALIVRQGDVVNVNLTNNLAEPTALLFQGQAMIPDLEGAAAGGTKSYTFTATNPGTFLYEAGLLDNAQHQVAMGLYGALVVRPTTAGQAYADASTAFTDEALVVLSEIDPALNNIATLQPGKTPADFDMRDYSPKYRLINGKAYPQTAPIDFATPLATPASRVLLRYVNAGLEHHSMALLGLHQTVIANDGSPLFHSHTVVADTIAPGETQDTIAAIPELTVLGTKFALYDASFLLKNSNAPGTGGMLTFLTAVKPRFPYLLRMPQVFHSINARSFYLDRTLKGLTAGNQEMSSFNLP